MSQRWQNIVAAEADLARRGDYALARIFAERVNRAGAWHDALEGFPMIESPIIAELLADKERTTKAASLLRVLGKRYGEIPEEVAKLIRTCADSDKADFWLDAAVEAASLAEFRRLTNL